MPKTALHFGAGNIGRGFITPILQENGYEVVLVDVDSDLVNKLNIDQEYSVNFIGSSKESIKVSNIKALNLSDSSEIQSLINNCDFVSTSVGPQYVNSVLHLISNLDLHKSINFVAFENKYRASTTAKNESDIDSKNITFIDVVIDKIVPLQSKDSLDVYVEEYGSIVFDKEAPLPLKPSDVIKQGDYDYEFKKKLWMLNGLHLCLAYYGLSEILTYGAFTYPIAFLITDLANRSFGKLVARKIVYVGFTIGIFFTLIFSTNFTDLISIRIAIGSGTAFIIAQLLDVQIFDQLRQRSGL